MVRSRRVSSGRFATSRMYQLGVLLLGAFRLLNSVAGSMLERSLRGTSRCPSESIPTTSAG